MSMALRLCAGRAFARLPAPLAGIPGRWIHQGTKAEQKHPEPVPLAKLKDSFLDGTSATYLENIGEKYSEDPKSVDKSWASFFQNLGAVLPRLSGEK